MLWLFDVYVGVVFPVGVVLFDVMFVVVLGLCLMGLVSVLSVVGLVVGALLLVWCVFRLLVR